MDSSRKPLLIFILLFLTSYLKAGYLIGAGQYDITGPAADIMMMGYVDPKQKTSGISSRLRARSFIIVDEATGNRVVLMNIDQIHVYEANIQKLVEKLKSRFGNLYNEKNILSQATHTHSAPGGFSHYKLYTSFSTLGFSEQNFNAVVEGMYESIVRAHENLAPGKIKIARGELLKPGVNRSPEAYLLNPEAERKRYTHNTDKTMTVLKFEGIRGNEIGVISWFAVHATSMQKTNHLISSDNKGYAEYLFEKEKKTNYFEKQSFVASFSNSNAGDVSPSDGEDFDGDGGWDCDLVDIFKCTERAGREQFEKANELYEQANEEISGIVDYRHRFVDLSHLVVSDEYTHIGEQNTCPGAIGISMLAGAEDGRGVGKEGQNCSHPNALTVSLCLSNTCHGEKPVVINMGKKRPYPWTPQILPVSVVRIGQLVLVGVPAEFTTMSGRRVREGVEKILRGQGVKYSVLAGYANGYAGYVATPEEYQKQDYEGASTHFGQWTLPAYQQEINKLAVAMANQEEIQSNVLPLDLSDRVKNNLPANPPAYDQVPNGLDFGSVKSPPKVSYHSGELVGVDFWSSYPNRDLLTQSSFLEVQKKVGEEWKTIRYDWDFDTKYIWLPQKFLEGVARIEWQSGSEKGTFRILHRAVAKGFNGALRSFQGVSTPFVIE